MTDFRSGLGAAERWRAVLDTSAALLGVLHLRLASAGEAGVRRSIGTGRVPDGPATCRVARRAWESGETVRATDAARDPRWRDAPEIAEGWRAFLAVPLPDGTGVLVAMDRRPRTFDETAVRHMRHLAEWAAADGALIFDSGENPERGGRGSARSEASANANREIRVALNVAIDRIRRAADAEPDPERRVRLAAARNSADELLAWMMDPPGPVRGTAGSPVPDVPASGESARRILLAGDNPVNRDMARDLLRSRGHAVEIAATGLEALETFAAGTFDLVFVDLRMAGMDGFETARRLRDLERNSGKRTPICGIGAGLFPDEARRCRAAGMDDLLARPILSEILCETAARLTTAAPEAPATPGAVEPAGPEPSSGTGAPVESALNREGLLEIVGGSSRIARELVRLYLQNSPEMFADVTAAAEKADAEALKQTAHALKGMSLNLSAKPVADAALRLERIGRSGKLEGASVEIARLKAELNRLRDAMDIFLEELPPD